MVLEGGGEGRGEWEDGGGGGNGEASHYRTPVVSDQNPRRRRRKDI